MTTSGLTANYTYDSAYQVGLKGNEMFSAHLTRAATDEKKKK